MSQGKGIVTIETDSIQYSPDKLPLLRKWIDAGIDLLFPPRCVACSSLGNWLCSTCASSIELLQPPLCGRCGLPLQDPGRGAVTGRWCSHCRQLPQEWEGLLAYGYYDGPLREAIHQFKYEDMHCLASILASLMAEGWRRLSPAGWLPQAIVPIPLHPSRQRQRGYNQAALLARELGTHLHCPVVEGALVRVRATAPQVGLGIEERRVNVHRAFRCTNTRLHGRNILLVDDVCTTGATLASACLALKAAGAASVLAYTLARAKPGGQES
jgi:ComF family protein